MTKRLETDNALKLLTVHYTNTDDESSDEEVTMGSRVSTKRIFRSDHEEGENSARKKLCNSNKLPVPDLLHKRVSQLGSGNMDEEWIDDPEMHGGRSRSFSHERGNWATFVYVPCSKNDAIDETVALLLSSDAALKVVDDFHISLSRTVVLKYHWITTFIESLRNTMCNKFSKFFVNLHPTLKVYTNDERSRTFIGIQVRSAMDILKPLTEAVDSCLSEFKLPVYYQNPSFHVSVVWCVGDRKEELTSLVRELEEKLIELFSNFDHNSLSIFVQEIFCRSGNKLFSVALK